MANYRILSFGNSLPDEVKTAISTMAGNFDLHLGDEIEIVDGATAVGAPIATAAIYVGANPVPSFSSNWILRAGIPLIPIYPTAGAFGVEIPPNLQHLNAKALSSKDGANSIAAAIMEALRLLPQQRRVFMSYVRKEATEMALQLFADLESRQFRVFVDTHGVRPGAKFQADLWQSLCDSDVMVMLDTPHYFKRQWTREEFGKANLKKAAILRVAFPGVVADPSLSITDTIVLDASEIEASGRLTLAALDRIGDKIESLRSRSIATRNAGLVGSIRTAVTQMGGEILISGGMRRVVAILPSGKKIFAYPAVGVPTARILHDVSDHAESNPAAIVYDAIGLHEEWINHLKWLGENVTAVRWIQSVEAAWDFAGWDAEP